MAEMGRLRVERIAVARIKPAAYNPRKLLRPGDREYEALKRSIETFGYIDPLVWNKRSGNLVGGHQRFSILVNEYGLTEVDVSVVDLDDAAERALNLALNKIAGAWDDDALAELLAGLEDPGVTGFTEKEIAALIGAEDADGEVDTAPQLGGLAYKVVVDCRSEQHQRELLKRFNREKLACRALIS